MILFKVHKSFNNYEKGHIYFNYNSDDILPDCVNIICYLDTYTNAYKKRYELPDAIAKTKEYIIECDKKKKYYQKMLNKLDNVKVNQYL